MDNHVYAVEYCGRECVYRVYLEPTQVQVISGAGEIVFQQRSPKYKTDNCSYPVKYTV